MMVELLELSATGLQRWTPIAALRSSAYLYPLLNAIHIAGFALLFGAIAVVDVRLLRSGRMNDEQDQLPIRLAQIGFVVAASTGALLFATQAVAYLDNPFLWLKFGLIALAGSNVLWMWRASRTGRGVRASATLSLLLWFGTILTARMIGFW